MMILLFCCRHSIQRVYIAGGRRLSQIQRDREVEDLPGTFAGQCVGRRPCKRRQGSLVYVEDDNGCGDPRREGQKRETGRGSARACAVHRSCATSAMSTMGLPLQAHTNVRDVLAPLFSNGRSFASLIDELSRHFKLEPTSKSYGAYGDDPAGVLEASSESQSTDSEAEVRVCGLFRLACVMCDVFCVCGVMVCTARSLVLLVPPDLGRNGIV